jgi:hypothetical protein
MDHTEVKKAIIRSQHCQRNWDLQKQIPKDDIDLIIHSVTNCPSKQNISFYKVHAITNRQVIENIHDNTSGFLNYETGKNETNSQVLANLVLAFEVEDYMSRHTTDTVHRNDEMWAYDDGKLTAAQKKSLEKDAHMAIGIAAGYANLISSMLNYGTGCCACFDADEVATVVGAKNPIKLLMGIGIKDETRPRREHHTKPEFVFPTKSKQEIQVNFIN